MEKFSVVFLISALHLIYSSPLDRLFSHYEQLNYSTDAIKHAHFRVRRSVETTNFPTPSIRFPLNVLEMNITLILLPKEDFISSSSIIIVGDDPLADGSKLFDHLYRGFVEGYPGSAVHGAVNNGVFHGSVSLSKFDSNSFHIEPAGRYFDEIKSFHSIAYHDHAVNLAPHMKFSESYSDASRGKSSFCGVYAPKFEETDSGHAQTTANHPSELWRSKRSVNVRSFPPKYSLNQPIYDASRIGIREAARQAPTNRVCNIFLRSDTTVWDHVIKMPHINNDREAALKEIGSMFSAHMEFVKDVFIGTVFTDHSQEIKYTGISFRLDGIQINITDQNCKESPRTGPKQPLQTGSYAEDNPFCSSNIDANSLLGLHSYGDYDEFCLSYLFTNRDLAGGVLGYAFVGAPNELGGICHGYDRRSKNTGFVTLLNHGFSVAPLISKLTLLHEIGHSFGARHDDEQQPQYNCFLPTFSKGGSYVMHPTSTDGIRENNKKFSPCSKDSIARNLDSVFSSNRNCFISSDDPFCGNHVVEKGEQCDCGIDAQECKDQCCHPASSTNKCRLKDRITVGQITKEVRCSPTEGQCCSADCQYRDRSHLCMAAGECHTDTYCDGSGSKCPTPIAKNDGELCQNGHRTCKGGQCIGSLCELVPGWTECFVERSDKVSLESMCHIACRRQDQPESECVSAYNLNNSLELQAKYRDLAGILLKHKIRLNPGMSCDNYRGYCDARLRCRPVEDDGPLTRLRKSLFSEKMLSRIRDWILTHWWAVLLIAIASVVSAVVFVKIFAYSTPHARSESRLPDRYYTNRRDMGRFVSPGYWNATLQTRARTRRGHGSRAFEVEPSAPPKDLVDGTAMEPIIPRSNGRVLLQSDLTHPVSAVAGRPPYRRGVPGPSGRHPRAHQSAAPPESRSRRPGPSHRPRSEFPVEGNQSRARSSRPRSGHDDTKRLRTSSSTPPPTYGEM